MRYVDQERFAREYSQVWGQRSVEDFHETFDELFYKIEEELYNFHRRGLHDLRGFLKEIIESVIRQYNYSEISDYTLQEIEKTKKVEMFILGFTKKIDRQTTKSSKYKFFIKDIQFHENDVRIEIIGYDNYNTTPYRKIYSLNPYRYM